MFFNENVLVKSKKKTGKNLRKSGKVREFDGIKKWEPCSGHHDSIPSHLSPLVCPHACENIRV